MLLAAYAAGAADYAALGMSASNPYSIAQNFDLFMAWEDGRLDAHLKSFSK